MKPHVKLPWFIPGVKNGGLKFKKTKLSFCCQVFDCGGTRDLKDRQDKLVNDLMSTKHRWVKPRWGRAWAAFLTMVFRGFRVQFQPRMMMRKTNKFPILAKPESSPETQKPPFHDVSFMLTGSLQPHTRSVRLRRCSCNLRVVVGCFPES